MSCIPDEIDTPDVLIDRDILDRNIGRMSSAVAAKGDRPASPREDAQAA